MYCLISPLTTLVQNVHLQKECLHYITIDEKSANSLSFSKILGLYCHLRQGMTIREFRKQYSIDHLGIDIRRFIGFGVLKGFLRRIHKYPIYDASMGSSVSKSLSTFQQHLYS
jgi:nitrogen permease regulator 2-like protein